MLTQSGPFAITTPLLESWDFEQLKAWALFGYTVIKDGEIFREIGTNPTLPPGTLQPPPSKPGKQSKNKKLNSLVAFFKN